MPKIYDNTENHLTTELNDTLPLSHRADFCVGYFNLKGWNKIADKIEKLPGAAVVEGDEQIQRYCRLPVDTMKESFSRNESYLIDQAEVLKLKKILASEFKPIIGQIDALLAQHYRFTHSERDFIINYDIKYRLGKELDGRDGSGEK